MKKYFLLILVACFLFIGQNTLQAQSNKRYKKRYKTKKKQQATKLNAQEVARDKFNELFGNNSTPPINPQREQTREKQPVPKTAKNRTPSKSPANSRTRSKSTNKTRTRPTSQPKRAEKSPVSTVYRGSKKKLNKQNKQVIKDAQKYLGTPYKWGGNTPKGLDCSGLTQQVYKKNGYNLPRTSKEQARVGKKISLNKAQKGDLVFFGKRKIDHVGIVISNKREPLKIIHATSSEGVTITEVNDSTYWTKRLKKAVRVIK